MKFSLLSFLTSVGFASAIAVDLKVLLIGNNGSHDAFRAYEEVFEGYGIPYNRYVVDFGETLQLKNTDGSGKYSLVVFPNSYYWSDPTGTWTTILNSDQQATLDAYETEFKIRRVASNIYPWDEHVRPKNSANPGCCSGENLFSFNESVISNIVPNLGLSEGATLSSIGLYHYPAEVFDYSITTPIVLSSAGIIATINNKSDGRQMMHFYTPFGSWSFTSSTLSHLVVNWGFKNIIPGYRRISLNLQIDDFFLKTETWNSATQLSDGPENRMVASDLNNHYSWQTKVNQLLGAGSSVKLEFGYNGNGILEQINDPSTLSFSAPDTFDNNFVKPLGTGIDYWPDTYNTTYKSWKITNLNKDPLFKWVSSKNNANKFNYISHTFTHENFNNITYFDANNELYFNKEMSKLMDVYGKPFHSDSGMITPSISGLFNGDAIAAILNNGITNAVGDNSRANLINQQNPHLGLITTASTNGYDGLFIIPRDATIVYYNVYTVEQNLDEYKNIYKNTIYANDDYETILGREVSRFMSLRSKLRHDPHMFHQLNCKITSITTDFTSRTSASLLMKWTDRMLFSFRKVFQWPIVSYKQDDLAQNYKARRQRDACNWTASMNYLNNVSVSGITLKSESSCTIPITVGYQMNTDSDVSLEKISGVDGYTYWIKLNPNQPKTVNFIQPQTIV